MGDARTRRLAANENLARRLNEMTEHQRVGNGDSGNHFVCECSKEECVDTVDIDVTAYGYVRQHPRRFVLRKGHDNPAIEMIVERYPAFDIVEKRGEAGRLAEADAE